MNEQLEEVGHFYNVIIDFVTNYSIQILGAILIMMIGVVASKYVQKYLLKLLSKTKIDETISGFIAKTVRFIIIAMMGMLALGKLGISIGPFIAALGAVSLTAGLALQGSVSNFAAGVILVATKPFKIGDTIKMHNVYGEVKEIRLAYTVLTNEDKEQVTIPNKYMIGDVLINSYAYRLVEGSVGISYDSDTEKTIILIGDAISTCKDTSDENEAIIGIENFGDSAINIAYRYWVFSDKFFKTQYEVNMKILQAIKETDITIPFPQLEIKDVGLLK
jgi:small conductance mechanosensitive channel